MERKALFFDIDGTLLSEITGKVPKSAYTALERVTEQGHLAFINTGRTWSSLPDQFKAMPFSGFLCGCGTDIRYEGRTLFSYRIPMDRANEIIDLMIACRADMILEGEQDCYFPENRSRFENLERTRRDLGRMGLGLGKAAGEKNLTFSKFVFYADEQTDKGRLFSNLAADMDYVDRRGFYEWMPKGLSKASAIARVLEHFHIDRENAYVFGDSSNDLSMFQCVPHAVAMGVHDPALDPYTEFVTKTVEEDGIAYALVHYGIIPAF